jgi:hypothetical protein
VAAKKIDDRIPVTLRLTTAQNDHLIALAKGKSITRQQVLEFAVNVLCYIEGADAEERENTSTASKNSDVPRLIYQHRDRKHRDRDLGVLNILP